MAWQPPADWREMSGDQRRAYLEQHGMHGGLIPVDWESLDRDKRTQYRQWRDRILSDTPEERVAKELEHRRKLRGWQAAMGWFAFCLLAGLWIVWGTNSVGDSVGARVGITAFAIVGYTVAFAIPGWIAKPTKPRD
jgi:hypothetical protein